MARPSLPRASGPGVPHGLDLVGNAGQAGFGSELASALLMTDSTSRPIGLIPVFFSYRPTTISRCASHAAGYSNAPFRVYSDSIRRVCLGWAVFPRAYAVEPGCSFFVPAQHIICPLQRSAFARAECGLFTVNCGILMLRASVCSAGLEVDGRRSGNLVWLTRFTFASRTCFRDRQRTAELIQILGGDLVVFQHVVDDPSEGPRDHN